MLRYGIPAFRLPRQVLDAEIQMIRNLGAEFRLGKRLGRDFTLDDLRRDFDAVFLAIGAQGSRGLGCPGEELATPALEFLEKLTDGPAPTVGSDVIVVGGGNTAMDASRCAVRLGAKSVRVLYRRTRREMPCLMEEVEAAEAEGVKIEFLVAPVRLERKAGKLILTCQRMELGPPDESGRARPMPIPGSEFEVQATCVIAAIGQSVDLSPWTPRSSLYPNGASPPTRRRWRRTLPGVFAGGDAVTGPDLAVRAVAAGKLAAASIDQYLSGKKVIGAPESVNVLMGKLSEDELAVFLRGIEQTPRAPMPHLPMDKRRTTFEEVELGFSLETATRESRRCLGCGCGKAIPCRLRQFATEYGVDPQRFVGERRHFARDTSHPGHHLRAGQMHHLRRLRAGGGPGRRRSGIIVHRARIPGGCGRRLSTSRWPRPCGSPPGAPPRSAPPARSCSKAPAAPGAAWREPKAGQCVSPVPDSPPLARTRTDGQAPGLWLLFALGIPALKIVGLARQQQVQVLVRSLEFLDSGGRIDLDRRKRVVMQAQDLAAAHKLRRLDGVLNAHREIVPDGQRGKRQPGGVADQFHVQRQRGVPRVVEIPVGAFDDEPAGVPAIRSIRQAAGVDCVDELDAPEIEPPAAAVVQWMGLLQPLFAEPHRYLIIGDDGRAGPFGDVHRVGHVVRVSV